MWPPKIDKPKDFGIVGMPEIPDDLDFPVYDRGNAPEVLQRVQERPTPLWRAGARLDRLQRILDDPTQREGLLASLRRGIPLHVVLKTAGITSSKWRIWEKEAARGVEPFASFAFEAGKASAEGVLGLLNEIRACATGAPDKDGVWKRDWKAAQYLAEKSDQELAREPVQAVAVLQAEVDASQLDLSRLSTEELADLYLLTAKAESTEAPEEHTAEPYETAEP